MDKFFGINGKRDKRQPRLIDTAKRPEPKPKPGEVIEREAPPLSMYFDPDTVNGRPRIVIMLSEDGSLIEPLLQCRMSGVQMTSVLVQQAAICAEQMFQIAYAKEIHESQMAAQIESMEAEIAFLRKQIAQGAKTPPVVGQPAPTPDIIVREVVGDD